MNGKKSSLKWRAR